MTTTPQKLDHPLAHVTADGRPHLLLEHLLSVGNLAEQFAIHFPQGSAQHAQYIGRLHDLGKYADQFQNMIRTANGFDSHVENPDSIGGARDHSTAGAVFAHKHAKQCALPATFCIAGHHAGLPNAAHLKDRLSNKAQQLDFARSGRYKPHDDAVWATPLRHSSLNWWMSNAMTPAK